MKETKLLIRTITLIISFISLSTISCSNLRKLEEASEDYPLDKALKTYYYDQLEKDSLEEKFYKAIKNMYDSGLLKKGTESIDVVEKGFLSQKEIDDNSSDSMRLVYAMGGARDAFVLDYPEVFYVNFEKLSIRVFSKNKDGQRVPTCLLGIGRSTDYFSNGFTSETQVDNAINEFKNLLATAVSSAKSKTTNKEKITEAHDYIVNNFKYKLEIDEGVTDVNTLRSVYGGLKNNQGMCETFAKVFKALMDELQIPCISVIGKTFDQGDTETGNPHMWNNLYLKLEDEKYWYAVDTTYDQGKKTTNYLLADQETMYYHIPDKLVSEANYPFYYPHLYIKKISSGTGGPFKVEKVTESGYNCFKVSYKGKGFESIQEDGIYLLVAYKSDISGEWKEWTYVHTGSYEDKGDYFIIYYEYLGFKEIKFAATKKAYVDKEVSKVGQYIYGAENMFDETASVTNDRPRLDLPEPFPCKVSPHSQEKLEIGKTYPVTVVFDEDLDQVGELSLTIESSASVILSDTKYEDLKFTPPRTLTFKFTTSKKYAANTMNYNIYFNGLQGKIVKKAPYHISFFVLNQSNIGCPLKYGSTYSVYGKVQLLENADLSTKDWEINGKKIDKDLSVGVSLVVSKTAEAEEQKINNSLGEKYGTENVLTSSTYDIGLTLCCTQMKHLPYGQRMKIMLPFPEGYGPHDAGVNFQAYHYNRETNQMEEVECMINENGVVIYVNSFSPFTLAALNSAVVPIPDTKKILSITGEGGKVDKDLILLNIGENDTVTYTPNDGFVLDYALLNGELQTVSNDNKITFTYDGLSEKSNYLEAYFTPLSTKTSEGDASPIIPQAGNLIVTIKENDNKTEIYSDIQGNSGTVTYTWYKNGNKIVGDVEPVYKLSDGELGTFKVEVTNIVMRTSSKTMSNELNLYNSDKGNNNKFPTWAIALIVVAVVVFLATAGYLIYLFKFKKINKPASLHSRAGSAIDAINKDDQSSVRQKLPIEQKEVIQKIEVKKKENSKK